MKTAVGYVRVSTIEQAQQGVSLKNQQAKIKAWAKLNGYALKDVYRDEGISGKAMDNRDGLQSALKSVGKGDALVVYSLSRMARSTRDALAIAEALQHKGADLVSVTEHIDTTTAAGKMVFRMLAVLNEFERDQVSERVTQALAYKRGKNEWVGRVPYGFRVHAGKLVEDTEQIESIKKMKRLRKRGKTLRDISKTFGVSPAYVLRAVNVNLRTLKAKYLNGSRLQPVY
ncbi:MAG: recombinase family protein [Thermodesulfobacteriota bacterium]|nr:recombinase family protein [Thermodesulfobacteriota bacterium]